MNLLYSVQWPPTLTLGCHFLIKTFFGNKNTLRFWLCIKHIAAPLRNLFSPPRCPMLSSKFKIIFPTYKLIVFLKNYFLNVPKFKKKRATLSVSSYANWKAKKLFQYLRFFYKQKNFNNFKLKKCISCLKIYRFQILCPVFRLIYYEINEVRSRSKTIVFIGETGQKKSYVCACLQRIISLTSDDRTATLCGWIQEGYNLYRAV